MAFVEEASSSGRLGDEHAVSSTEDVFQSTYELVFSTAVRIRQLQYMPIRVRARSPAATHQSAGMK